MARLYTLVALMFLAIICVPTAVSALSPEQRKLYNQNVLYYDLDACEPESISTGVTAGTGSPSGAAFPNLPPAAMADAIDAYIDKTNPDSRLKGLGNVIVSSSKAASINPFLLVAIAQKESSLSSPNDFNVRKANNSFGRTATSSQPNFLGAKLWYKWTSVRASVDHNAPENKSADGGGDMAAYMRKQFGDKIDSGNLVDLMLEYAPPGENNTSQYVADIKKWTREMISLANTGGVASADAASATPADGAVSGPSCCAPGASGSVSGDNTTLRGKNNIEKVYNYLIDKGLTPNQAAGITGNLMHESGGNGTDIPTNISNPRSGAYGIAQWLHGRLTELKKQASTKGVEVDDLKHQLDYLWWEITEGPEKIYNVLAEIKAMNDLEQIVIHWEEQFERSEDVRGDVNMNRRIEYAKKVRQDPAAGGGAASPAGGSSTDCGSAGAEGSGSTIGAYAIPVPKKFWTSNPDWFTKPHHDYPAADIPVKAGTPIYSMTAGKVISVGMNGGAGYAVFIDNEGVTYGYFHGTPGSAKVKPGETVTPGKQLMLAGYTGSVRPPGPAGAHLHVEIVANGLKRCPQAIFSAMRSNSTPPQPKDLPTSGCTY